MGVCARGCVRAPARVYMSVYVCLCACACVCARMCVCVCMCTQLHEGVGWEGAHARAHVRFEQTRRTPPISCKLAGSTASTCFSAARGTDAARGRVQGCPVQDVAHRVLQPLPLAHVCVPQSPAEAPPSTTPVSHAGGGGVDGAHALAFCKHHPAWPHDASVKSTSCAAQCSPRPALIIRLLRAQQPEPIFQGP